MKLVPKLLLVVPLLGVALAVPVEKDKRSILPGDSRYSPDHQDSHHHHHENEIEISRALGGYTGSFGTPDFFDTKDSILIPQSQYRIIDYGGLVAPNNDYLAPAIKAAGKTVSSPSNSYGTPTSTFKTFETIKTADEHNHDSVATKSESPGSFSSSEAEAKSVIAPTLPQIEKSSPTDVNFETSGGPIVQEHPHVEDVKLNEKAEVKIGTQSSTQAHHQSSKDTSVKNTKSGTLGSPSTLFGTSFGSNLFDSFGSIQGSLSNFPVTYGSLDPGLNRFNSPSGFTPTTLYSNNLGASRYAISPHQVSTYSVVSPGYASGFEVSPTLHQGVAVRTVNHHVPVHVPQPYAVPITKNVPYPVPVPHPVDVPRPYIVRVPQPYRVEVNRPVAVNVPRAVPYPVPRYVQVKTPVPHPVPVPQPVEVPVHVPVFTSDHIPFKPDVSFDIPSSSVDHSSTAGTIVNTETDSVSVDAKVSPAPTSFISDFTSSTKFNQPIGANGGYVY